VDGQDIGEFVVDINFPDIIVPVCDPQRPGPQACYDPRQTMTKSSFGYCDNGKAQCYDRMKPRMGCARKTTSSKWTLETSVWSQHELFHGGFKKSIHAFEFEASFGSIAGVPMKGSLSVVSPILGIAPSRMSCRNSTMASSFGSVFLISQDAISFFEPKPGDLENTAWTQEYQLVPINNSLPLGKYAFNIFSPSIGHVDVLGKNVSSHWTTLIDTTQECLIIPDFMLENIRAWTSGDGTDLRFYLEDGDVGDGRPFVSIPLKETCIKTFHVNFDDSSIISTAINTIFFGTASLKAILRTGENLVFETSQPFRIRFPTSVEEVGREYSGINVPSCIGEQLYYQPRNVCIDPDCGLYFFSELNEEARVCVWRPFVAYMVYTTVIGYILMELFAQRLKSRAVDLAQFACERNISSE